jgi:hypothetical protein
MSDAMGQMMGGPMIVTMGGAIILLLLLLVFLGLAIAALVKYLRGPA